jgi:hypothetical protein
LRDKSISNFKSTSVFSNILTHDNQVVMAMDCFKLLEIASINIFFYIPEGLITSG